MSRLFARTAGTIVKQKRVLRLLRNHQDDIHFFLDSLSIGHIKSSPPLTFTLPQRFDLGDRACPKSFSTTTTISSGR